MEAVHVSIPVKEMMLRTANGGIARGTAMSSGLLPVFGVAVAMARAIRFRRRVPRFTCTGRMLIIDSVVA